MEGIGSFLSGLMAPDLSGIIDKVLDIAKPIKEKAQEIWGGVKTFFTETLPDKIPGMGTA